MTTRRSFIKVLAAAVTAPIAATVTHDLVGGGHADAKSINEHRKAIAMALGVPEAILTDGVSYSATNQTVGIG